jgi:hypothetical protein
MNEQAIVNAALLALQGILSVIGEIRGQGGVTDDQIAAQVQTLTQGNDQAYAAMMAVLNPPKS